MVRGRLRRPGAYPSGFGLSESMPEFVIQFGSESRVERAVNERDGTDFESVVGGYALS